MTEKMRYSDLAFSSIKAQINEDNWQDCMPACIVYYRDLEARMPASDLLRLVRAQYADMARGGDGGAVSRQVEPGKLTDMQYLSVREANYPEAPNEFFRELCDLLGWAR